MPVTSAVVVTTVHAALPVTRIAAPNANALLRVLMSRRRRTARSHHSAARSTVTRWTRPLCGHDRVRCHATRLFGAQPDTQRPTQQEQPHNRQHGLHGFEPPQRTAGAQRQENEFVAHRAADGEEAEQAPTPPARDAERSGRVPGGVAT